MSSVQASKILLVESLSFSHFVSPISPESRRVLRKLFQPVPEDNATSEALVGLYDSVVLGEERSTEPGMPWTKLSSTSRNGARNIINRRSSLLKGMGIVFGSEAVVDSKLRMKLTDRTRFK